jgi:ABC-type dipeptide/oligopeptide/nickel transport system ATPase component
MVVADRLMIMYLGQAPEISPVEEVTRHPKHPHTHALIGATLVHDLRSGRLPPTPCAPR